jgi:hypothetical protein
MWCKSWFMPIEVRAVDLSVSNDAMHKKPIFSVDFVERL